MSKSTATLLQQLGSLPALKDASTEDLQAITEQFPYFSAAQVLLYKKLLVEHRANDQKNKAALHVYHPLQLETAFNEEVFDFDLFAESTEPVAIEVENTPAAVLTPVLPDATAPLHTTEPDLEEAKVELVQNQPINENEIIDEAIEEEKIPETAAPSAATLPEPKFPSFSLPTPATNNGLALTFEPYHTVDYFASQGIKLSKAEAGNDRFGKQLKSFTEWLKTMKKLPSTAITSNTDNVGERRVESLAAHSLQNSDVVTESMAEVWLKQGNLEKASEVYNKLSLQNPSKKAYFAAKIENLKKPN